MTDITTEVVEQNTDFDSLGPVDYIVVEFSAGAANFYRRDGEGVARIGRLRTVRADRHPDPDQGRGRQPSRRWSSRTSKTLDRFRQSRLNWRRSWRSEDVVHLAAAMDPGSTAGVLIWENLWAAPFAAAARHSGGQLIATGRIPIQAIIASIEADEAHSTEGDRHAADQHASAELASSDIRWRKPQWWPSSHTRPLAGCENRRSGRSSHTWPLAGREDCCSGGGGDTREGGAPANLVRVQSFDRRADRWCD